jgi:uncharacterized protein (TIGR02265 family)
MIPDGSSLIPFRGEVDIERLIAKVPPGFAIKGAFVGSNAAIVADEWPQLEKALALPPRNGKYLAFSDYPLTDFLRVTHAAARKKYPGIPSSEAHRLLSRSTFDVFAQTTLGRVTLTLVSGPASLLSKYEEIFNRMVKGPRVKATVTGEQSIDMLFTQYYSTREAIFGVLEGAVIACHFEPTVRVESQGEGTFRAVVTWKTW